MRMDTSDPAKCITSKTCNTPLGKEIQVLWDRELRMDFGTMMEIRQRSKKDKFFRKKYIGV